YPSAATTSIMETLMRCALLRQIRAPSARTLACAAVFVASVSAEALAADYSAAMRLTVDGWLASQTAEGLFPYGFDFLADSPLEPDPLSSSKLILQASTDCA